jgi:hypothetical protein
MWRYLIFLRKVQKCNINKNTFHCRLSLLQSYLKWYWFWIWFPWKHTARRQCSASTKYIPTNANGYLAKNKTIQQNVLKCDLAILFVRHRFQRCHRPLNHWPWSGRVFVFALPEVRRHALFPVNSPKFSHICNWSGQFCKTNLNIWCILE